MPTINELRQEGYYSFQNHRRDSIARMAYLENLALESGYDIGSWDSAPYLVDHALGGLRAPSKTILTRLFKEELEKRKPKPVDPKVISEAEQKQLELSAKTYDRVTDEQLRQALEDRTNASHQAIEEVMYALRAEATARAEQTRRQKTPSTLPDAVERLVKDGFYSYLGTENNGMVWFSTPRVVLSFVNRKAEIDLTVDMGRYKVGLFLQNYDCYVRTFEDNLILGDTIHPHAKNNSATGICWGNATAQYRDYKMKRDGYGVLTLLAQLLQIYSDQNPYQPLYAFADLRKQILDQKRQQQADRKREKLPPDMEDIEEGRAETEAVNAAHPEGAAAQAERLRQMEAAIIHVEQHAQIFAQQRGVVRREAPAANAVGINAGAARQLAAQQLIEWGAGINLDDWRYANAGQLFDNVNEDDANR